MEEGSKAKDLYVCPSSAGTNVHVSGMSAHVIIDVFWSVNVVGIMELWPYLGNVARYLLVGLVDTADLGIDEVPLNSGTDPRIRDGDGKDEAAHFARFA